MTRIKQIVCCRCGKIIRAAGDKKSQATWGSKGFDSYCWPCIDAIIDEEQHLKNNKK
ncbi:hypothetical protein I2494_15525 [Budviciaceae bacterium BWR-B9]|uniref:DUF3330 domain-containing protein n=1 Tax=Limnobaculum allomyrinae TaxID=2791986 RepID=A0ABS1ITU4_9GAMM|nr:MULTISPECIES: hypothetical protein [Limnobaculum]MBK5145099.1 hypothetical protein [Limnobaculum allomyrinae]MBV7692930.1 hypothetical protein [Limnobaculum sp. M2-1]